MFVGALHCSKKDNVVDVGKINPDHECSSCDDDLGLGILAQESPGLNVVQGPIECVVKA